MQISRFGMCVLAFNTLLHVTVIADAPDQDRIEGEDGNWVVMRTLDVIVTDEDGEPIADAYLNPYAMRIVENGGNGHGYWNNDVMGPPKIVRTDADGLATIRFPKAMHTYHQDMTVQQVSFGVQHALFVSQTVHLDLGPDRALAKTDVSLVEGAELKVSAVDGKKEPIVDFVTQVAGRNAPSIWSTDPDNESTKLTRSIQDGSWQTMLVAIRDDGKHLFSECFPLKFRKGKAVNLRGMPLTPGTVIRGKLSDNVPRPVGDGYVIATAAPMPAGSSYAKENPSLTWQDWAELQPDGSFVFPSMPRSGEVQLIVVCDGWLSKTTNPAAHFVEGQVFNLEPGEVDVTVEMEKTGTLDLTVVGADGKPFNSGKISSWPNQLHHKGGSTFLGRRFRKSDDAKLQLIPPDKRPSLGGFINPDDPTPPFMECPIANGKCVLKGLPIGKGERLILDDPEFTLIGDDPRNPQEVRYMIESSDMPAKMTLTVVARDTAEALQKAKAVMNAAINKAAELLE